MTIEDMHISFKFGADKADTLSTPNFEPEEVDLWLNAAQDRFVKTRYSGLNVHRSSLEETQKRMDDLREIITNAEITPSTETSGLKPNAVFFSLPNSSESLYWFAINEEAEIMYKDCNSTLLLPNKDQLQAGVFYILTSGSITIGSQSYSAPTIVEGLNGMTFTGVGTLYTSSSKRIEVKPIEHDKYNRLIKDPFNMPYENQALRLLYRDKAEIIGTESVIPTKYFLRYLKRPLRVLLDLTNSNNNVDCELSEHTHQEIVDLAVTMALENIESRRYQTNLNELNKQE